MSVGYWCSGHYISVELHPIHNRTYHIYDGIDEEFHEYLSSALDDFQPKFEYTGGIAEFVNCEQVPIQELKAGDHVSIYNNKLQKSFFVKDRIKSIHVCEDGTIEIIFDFPCIDSIPVSIKSFGILPIIAKLNP